jgi:hypothetical protein
MVDARQAGWLKEKIEWVFGLLGGELASEPWDGHLHWHEGTPEYVKGHYSDTVNYRTVIMDCATSNPPGNIENWKLHSTFSNSGETECPGGWMGDGTVTEQDSVEIPKAPEGTYRVCPYCENPLRTKHGMIYLGDGWVEAVYEEGEGSP